MKSTAIIHYLALFYFGSFLICEPLMDVSLFLGRVQGYCQQENEPKDQVSLAEGGCTLHVHTILYAPNNCTDTWLGLLSNVLFLKV